PDRVLSSRSVPPATRLPLFPYTTLFRSIICICSNAEYKLGFILYSPGQEEVISLFYIRTYNKLHVHGARLTRICNIKYHGRLVRSEEHTSELQSRENLVCRLLLEKKKNK